MAERTGKPRPGRRRSPPGPAPWAGGTDDIARGNVGTGDQGPGDVYPEDPVTVHTGELPLGPLTIERLGANASTVLAVTFGVARPAPAAAPEAATTPAIAPAPAPTTRDEAAPV